MIKTIDWYILKKYFLTFFFFLLALNLVVIIVDLSERTDDFAKANLPASRIITDYYFGFLPRINVMLFPLFVFISVIFFTSKMAIRSEVIAILGSGISFPRFLRPFFIGGLVLSALLWWVNQSFLPKANKVFAAFDTKYIGGPMSNKPYLNNFYFRLDSFSYAGIRYYDTTSRKGNNFFIQTFKNNRLVYNLRSETITWDTTANKWKLESVTERYINGIAEQVKQYPSLLMQYNFKPVDLQRDDYMKDKIATAELNDFIQLERIRGSEYINSLLLEKHTRNAVPLSVLILTLIAAIVASRKIRGGSGIHIAFGIMISVSYILLSRFSSVFASKGNFNPILAAWLPNFIFIVFAYFLYRATPK